MSTNQDVSICMGVIYTDPTGKDRHALVTNVFGPSDKHPSVNVAFVNDDGNQTDSYGHKIERATSTPHQSGQFAHGNCWRFKGEQRVQKTA